MTTPETFPCVLFITSHAFNHSNGGGVTFSNLFSGWPKERLATVHNDSIPPENDVCRHYFKLGAKELRKWGPFRLLQRCPPATVELNQAESKPLSDRSLISGKAFMGSRSELFGDNEFPETAILSTELEAWIEEFKPQVLYTVLGNNGLMDLIEKIRCRFNLPLVVHIMDDWRTVNHTKGLFAPKRRRKMQRQMAHFISVADCCMGISDSMCVVYEAEYGRVFKTFHNGIETDAGALNPARKKNSDESFKIFYAGAILPYAQLESMIDVCEAVTDLNIQGVPVQFNIVCPPAMIDLYREKLVISDAIHLRPTLASREDYLSAMRAADLLILPVNFSEETINFIRYSMPTKVPEMMQSGVPIFVYGPSEVAQVNYAIEHCWGYIVNERSIEKVVAAIKKLSADSILRNQLVCKARLLASERHDIKTIRTQFQSALADAAIDQSSN